MADIELVIKIPEEMYKWVKDVNKFFADYGVSDFIDLVENGTPLPKGHGDLIDRRKLVKELSFVLCRPVQSQMWIIEQAPAVPAIPISVIEGIKAELKEIYDFSFGDDMVEAKFGLRTAINLIDEKLKEYTGT